MKKVAAFVFLMVLMAITPIFITNAATKAQSISVAEEYDFALGLLDGVCPAKGGGLVMSGGESLAVFTSVPYEAADFTKSKISWQATVPKDTEVVISARVHVRGVGWSGWLVWQKNGAELPIWGISADKIQVRALMIRPDMTAKSPKITEITINNT